MAASKAHAIMIPLPYQGHINPFINLALRIASKGFAVTLVLFEFVHDRLSKSQNHIKPSFFSEACAESGLDVRVAAINDGFPLDFDRVLHRDEYWETLLRDFEKIVDEFVGKILDTNPSVASFLIADTLFSWPAMIAKKYNLVNVSFWTEPAIVYSLSLYIDLLRENGHFPCKDSIDEDITYIPGVDSINTKDLATYLTESDKSIAPQIAIKSFKEEDKADFVLHNTVYELESMTLSVLNQKQRHYAIGPVNFYRNLPINSVSNNLSLWSEFDCTKWLESKLVSSVLYVSFGSMEKASEFEQDIREIAHGLVLSGVDFIWIARPDTVDIFPHGFQEKIKDKGLIIPWCNQIQILSNPRIAGHLTHCGWNSVLESIWCSVPMICYPLAYDQPVNRKLILDDWKIGINVSDGKPVRRADVAENVKKLMNGSFAVKLRTEMKKMTDILRKASEFEGSSNTSFDKFIEDLKSMPQLKERVF